MLIYVWFSSFYANSGQMRVDIREDEKNYVVEAELPGVKKEEINLEVDENVLTIAVNRKEEVNEEQEKYIRRERRCSSMTRSFAVDNIRPDQATAKFENGILVIDLPKKEETVTTNKRIEIE